MVLPEDCRKIRALKYLFQPLVENAILHGIAEKAEGGHIHVEFQVIEGKLRFSVSDNGKGIPHDVLTDLLIDIYTGNLESKKNFALKNINSQLALYYGCLLYTSFPAGNRCALAHHPIFQLVNPIFQFIRLGRSLSGIGVQAVQNLQ